MTDSDRKMVLLERIMNKVDPTRSPPGKFEMIAPEKTGFLSSSKRASPFKETIDSTSRGSDKDDRSGDGFSRDRSSLKRESDSSGDRKSPKNPKYEEDPVPPTNGMTE